MGPACHRQVEPLIISDLMHLTYGNALPDLTTGFFLLVLSGE